MSGCTKSEAPTTTDTPAVTDEVSVTDVATVDEDGAKAIALEDAGIPETAAENLAVNSDEVDGKNVYVVKFEWSGYDYQYTIDVSTGEIVETIFNGSVI